MKYCIDEKVVSNMGLTVPELLAALLVKTGVSIDNLFKSLVEKEILVKTDNGYMITQRWNDVCEDTLLTSEKTIPTDDELAEFADKLRLKFPKGRKPGTPYYYRCNQREIILKLKKFFKLYGNTWSEDEILAATDKYIESMRGNNLMRIAKYFIWKNDDKQGEVSELATILENMDNDEDIPENDWTDKLL